MAGRHKRAYEVKPYFLRLPPALIERMDICCSMLDVATHRRLPKNARLQMALEEWCERVERESHEHRQQIPPTASTIPPDRSPSPIPHPLQESQPETPQKHEENEALERILAAREQYDKLSLREFSQLLYDRGIYSSLDRKTREQKPLDTGTLARWLRQGGMT
jgi:hypothetical protein